MRRPVVKLIDIRKEYGESFVEVVKGFARMGYSMRLTYKTLGIGERRFYKLVARFGLRDLFVKENYNEQCQWKGAGWPKGKSRMNELRYVLQRQTGVFINKSAKVLQKENKNEYLYDQ